MIKSNKTILLVDDDEAITIAEKIFLEKYGYKVITANTGESAVEKVDNSPEIDLILMDINLGQGIDGTQAAEQILQKHDLPIVFLSSHTEPEIIEKTEKITSYGYVVKNSSITVLDASIKMAFKLHDAYNKLKLEKNILKDVFESTLSGYWDWDFNNNTEYLSPTFKKMFGYEDHELLNVPETWQKLIYKDDLPKVMEVFENHVKAKGKIPFYNEIRYNHKNGSIVWVICAGRIIEWNNDGTPARMVGCHVDITERKKIEINLMENEEQYRALVETTNTGYVIIDNKGNVIDANSEYIRLTGKKDINKIRGRSVLEWTAGYEKEKNAQAITNCYKEGFIRNFEIDYIDENLNITPIEINATVTNIKGISCIVTLCRDISKRRQVEKALIDEQKRLNYILEATKTNIDIIDSNLNLKYVDSGWQKIYGEPNNKKCYDYFMGRDTICPDCGIPKALELKNIVITEEVLKKENRMIEVHTIPFQNEKGEWLVAEFNIDITGRKKAEDEIKQQLAEKEILLQEVHHRIKNNISSLSNLLSLQEKSSTSTEVKTALLDSISRINNMCIIYDRLLVSSDYEELSVKNYIESLIESIVNMFPEKIKITINKKIADFNLTTKKLFPIGMIVNELLTNIMKHAFMGKDRGLITVSIDKTENIFTLIIEDNGIGLTDKNDIEKSSGFGLMLVKMLVKGLGGSFEIVSNLGVKSIIKFNL